MLLSRSAPATGDTISLPASLLVAEGYYFRCFQHPTAAHYCIKLLHPQHHPARFVRRVNYFKALHRRGIYLDHIAAFHGLVNTSLGKGAIFEMVLDDDRRVSKSLDHYLALNDKRFNTWVIREIESLKQSFHHYWIAGYDLNPTNVLVKRLGFDEYRLVAVGGIGDNQAFPLASYSRKCARKKLISAWNQGHQQWFAEYPSVLTRLKPYRAV